MTEIDLEALEKERDILVEKLEAINRLIEMYKFKPDTFSYVKGRKGYLQVAPPALLGSVPPLDGFPIETTWLNQILYLLKNRKRFMSNHELADALTDYHFALNVDRMKRKVSVVISSAYKGERVRGLIKVGATKSAKDALWGFDKWLTQDNRIKEEHRPLGGNTELDIMIG